MSAFDPSRFVPAPRLVVPRPRRPPVRRLPSRGSPRLAHAATGTSTRALPDPDCPAHTPLINVACLWPEYFTAMLLGSKDWEYRARNTPDPALDAVREGEVVIFYESRSPRCLSSLIWEVQRSIDWKSHTIEYEFYLDMDVDPPCLLPCAWPRSFRPQGWSRWTTAQLRGKGVAI